MIEELEISQKNRCITWRSKGVTIEKTFEGRVEATLLSSKDGVLIVELFKKTPNNAVIFNADGSERVRVTNPRGQSAICFTEGGYEGEELTLITRLPGLEVACVIDENGSSIRQYEIR